MTHFGVHVLLMSLKTWASREVPQASNISELLAQRASWNSSIFRAIKRVKTQYLLTTHFSATTSKKTTPTTRKVQAKRAMVTYVLRINKPTIIYQ